MVTTSFAKCVHAFFMTLVFMISTAFVSLLYTFVVAPGLTNERPPGTLGAFLPAWFVLYELGMVAIVIYTWREEASRDPREREELGIMGFVSCIGLPLLFWFAREGIPDILFGLFLMGIMIAALCLAQRAHEEASVWCRSEHTGIST